MNPSHVIRRVDLARAMALNLRAVADECSPHPALAARWLQAAQTIDELCAMVEQATFVAQLNHATIIAGAGS